MGGRGGTSLTNKEGTLCFQRDWRCHINIPHLSFAPHSQLSNVFVDLLTQLPTWGQYQYLHTLQKINFKNHSYITSPESLCISYCKCILIIFKFLYLPIIVQHWGKDYLFYCSAFTVKYLVYGRDKEGSCLAWTCSCSSQYILPIQYIWDCLLLYQSGLLPT